MVQSLCPSQAARYGNILEREVSDHYPMRGYDYLGDCHCLHHPVEWAMVTFINIVNFTRNDNPTVLSGNQQASLD